MNKNILIERGDITYIVVIHPKRAGVITVDTNDLSLITRKNWHINSRGYATAGTAEGKTVLMHRLLLDFPIGVDHIDGNQLNNTRANLRVATPRQNMGNRKKNSNNTTGYRGVQRCRGRYKATVAGKHLGVFMNPKRAALVYDKAAREYFGDFARLNFPDK
jgi:hypothetical protein